MDETEERSNLTNNDESGSNEDVAFCLFYFEAVRKLLDIEEGLNASYLNRYFKLFREYFDCWCRKKRKLKNRDDSIQNLLKDSLYYRITYLYRNGALLSSAVGFHFRNALNGTPKRLRRILKNKSLKLCSLGRGSASDVVAIVTVLDGLAMEKGVQIDFKITIIDWDEKWKNTYITVLSRLQQFHKAKWRIHFIPMDLSHMGAYTLETFKSIREADIITMTMILSNCKSNAHRTNTLEYVGKLMQPKAMLFLLDWPRLDIIESSGGPTAEMNGFHLVYEELCGFHALDTTAVEKLFILYTKHFGNHQCNLFFELYARVWLKNSVERNANSRNKLQHIFQKNEEKYKPKESFLSPASFNHWKNEFLKRNLESGRGLTSTKRFVEINKDMRNALLCKLLEKRRLLNSSQKKLLSESELKDERHEIDGNIWEEYWSSKKELSLAKQNIYTFSVYSLRKLLNQC